jgi:hypothetical protein
VEQISNEIRIGYSDPEINAALSSLDEESRPFSRHFNQSEDFFLQLRGDYEVPHIPIHHDVRLAQPARAYAAVVRSVLTQIGRLAPQVLKGLTYFFDPAENLRPCFYRIYRFEDCHYLYLLRVDLMMRAGQSAVVERGTNDTTPHYTSRSLFLESTLIPLAEVVLQEGKVRGFRIRQTISQTWIGEYGRGYFQQGIWMDADLTRFFSRLFLPASKKTYPYFPFLCKYKTVCQAMIDLAPAARTSAVPRLHGALRLLVPYMERIQEEMKNESFSDEMKSFRELKEKVPREWYAPWEALTVKAYLNDQGMKEFCIED